jgi:hypothetical protein
MAEALQQVEAHRARQHGARQLGLYESMPSREQARPSGVRARRQPPLCAACRTSEARYGFRSEGAEDPIGDRPRTLCFECFRVEILRRQAVAARMARGWNAQQVRLPLDERLRRLDRARRRAQIAARHALGLT